MAVAEFIIRSWSWKDEPMRIAAPLLMFLMGSSLYAQTNCPAPDHNAPIPLALVSSPLIRFRPSLSQSALTVPTRVYVDVRATLKPLSVELWTGPTGTEVRRILLPIGIGRPPRSDRVRLQHTLEVASVAIPSDRAYGNSQEKKITHRNKSSD